MTNTERSSHELPVGSSVQRLLVSPNRMLLLAGIAGSVLYASMMWTIRFKGYSSLSQTVSELSAWGSPTRSLWIVLGTLYDVSMIAFAVGVRASARDAPRLRTAGTLLLVYGLLGLAWPFAAMHELRVLAAGGASLADAGHLVLAGVTVALMLGAMIFGAIAVGGRFRLYSFTAIVILLAFGGLTSVDAPRVQAGLPTPWAGVWERINIGVFLLWVVILAILLLRADDNGD